MLISTLCLISILLPVLGSPSKPHVFGSTTTFICPVSRLQLNITATTPFVQFQGSNQRLYFSSLENVKKYQNHPREYWLDPFTLPPPGRDGKRGVPDMYGKNVSCAVDTTTFIVNPMSSSRVMHVGGQCIYFCCQACQVSFWRDPGKYIVNAGADASSTIRPKSSEGGYPDLSATVVGFGSTFVVLSMVMTSFITVLAIFAVGKLYRGTEQANGWRNVVSRISYNVEGTDDEENITLPSYSDDVLETDEI